jgi:hypothetical protein
MEPAKCCRQWGYRYRWVNNQGDVILTDHNDFDPNESEEYKTREWKRSPISDRQ